MLLTNVCWQIPTRDPVQWVLSGGSSAAGPWTELQAQTTDFPAIAARKTFSGANLCSSSQRIHFLSVVLPEWIPLQAGDGWTLSSLGGSCNDACTALGKTCSQEDLHSANSLLSTDEEFQLIMTSLGSPCPAMSHDWGTQSDVPNIAPPHNKCHAPDADRDVSTFNCARTNSAVQRLCWCGPFEVSTPAPAPQGTILLYMYCAGLTLVPQV